MTKCSWKFFNFQASSPRIRMLSRWRKWPIAQTRRVVSPAILLSCTSYAPCERRRSTESAGADGGTEPTQSPGGIFIPKKFPEDTSVKTNSQDWSDRRWNRHCLWVSMPIFHLNFQSASLPLDHTMFVQFVPLDEARLTFFDRADEWRR